MAEGDRRLELLGGARLLGPDLTLGQLERKTAALLAYVALEAQPARARIAELLWPKAREATARNNLAQATARLRKAAGSPVLTGKEHLSLAGVIADVAELELAVMRRAPLPWLDAKRTRLLDGHEFDDCPEPAEWLDWRRQQVERTLMRALELESARLEQERDFGAAIERAEELLAHNRLSETSYQRLMHLHAARGDRARALAVLQDCQTMVTRELGGKPSRETLALAELIRRGAPSMPPTASDRAPPSLEFRLPPFVGRRDEWAAIDRALGKARAVFVSGEPGIGKTRLLSEYAANHGRHVWCEGRQADRVVPFSSATRSLRAIAEVGFEIPDWAKRELARILPELSGTTEAGNPRPTSSCCSRQLASWSRARSRAD